MTAIEDRYRWMDYALCAQVDPDLFFPELGPGEAAAAKRICSGCPVKAPCALFMAGFQAQFDLYGIAGGMAAPGRNRLRKELAAEERAA